MKYGPPQMPAYTIASNAGVEGAVVVGKLLEQTNLDIGYDAAKGTGSFCLKPTLVLLVEV